MDVAFVRVQRNGSLWRVTQSPRGEILAVYSSWQDAIDHARGLAAGQTTSIVEGEDGEGRLALRQLFRTDAHGVVHVQSLPLQARRAASQ